ncbi:MAG: sulfite exporter TauE/SafE family protein [Actinobacteria bacterium]|nr:sulfite exporter TauE/SafE family protein [Actinomycetota bacterium]
MLDHVSGAAIAGLLVASAAGGAIQGVIGFGFALVAVPAITLVEPRALPVTVLLMAFPMASLMALRERHHIDVGGFVSITAGRVFGTAAGVWVLLVVPAGSVSVLIGSLIVAAVALSVVGLDLAPKRSTTFGAGIVSGIMGTTAAIGGPALAVVYQRRPGPELRSTLALSYVVGLTLSLAALVVAGRVQRWQGILALELVPGMLVGLLASHRAARFLDRRWLRPAVLAFAAGAGVVIVIRGMTGT